MKAQVAVDVHHRPIRSFDKQSFCSSPDTLHGGDLRESAAWFSFVVKKAAFRQHGLVGADAMIYTLVSATIIFCFPLEQDFITHRGSMTDRLLKATFYHLIA